LETTHFWIFLIPPIAGGIIGYFTNDLAINMLFRPYRPIYLGKRKLPFTPGLIPSNQERLAKKVADTIMGSLLTPDELHKLAQRLLKLERLEAAIKWLAQLALEQVKQDKEQKSIKVVANILRDLFGQSLPRMLRILARKEDFLEVQINQVFDQILLDFKLNEAQAKQFADWILEIVLPPDVLRRLIVDFLTERNIQIIDEGFREKTSGTYWVVANLFGLRNSLLRLRAFCLEEPGITNARLKELTFSLEIRARIRKWLLSLSLQNLPVATVRQLRKTTRDAVRNYLQNRGADFIHSLGDSIDWENLASMALKRVGTSAIVNNSVDVISQELALILDRYLERDLEKIVAEVIPILSIDQVIMSRVKATTPENLEAAVQGIVKSELQAIVNLGGVLGFTIGLLQTVVLFFN